MIKKIKWFYFDFIFFSVGLVFANLEKASDLLNFLWCKGAFPDWFFCENRSLVFAQIRKPW